MIRDTSLCGLGQTAPNSILTTLRHFHDEFEDHIKAKRCRAGVCQDLALSPCENSCPLHMNIPRFLQLYKEGRLEDAFESVIMDNPLPASTGRVCQHPCDDRCRRQTRRRGGQHARGPSGDRRLGAAVGSVRRDGRPHRRQAPRADGPQGGAWRAPARRGSPPPSTSPCWGTTSPSTTSHAEAGGMLRFALPEYRLPKAVARPRNRDHPPPRRPLRLQHAGRRRRFAQRSRRPVRRGVPVDRHLEGRLGLSCRHRADGRHAGPSVPRGRSERQADETRRTRRHHRRRQRRHRFGPHGGPQGLVGDGRLSPRAQGHAGDPGGSRRRRAGGRAFPLPRRRRTASSASRARSRRSKSSRRAWANSTPRDVGGRSRPTKCISSPAAASSWRSAKAWTPISPAPPV